MKEFSEGSFNRVNDIENFGKVHLDIGEAGGGSTDRKIRESDKYFDIVTGTPPYFPLVNGALPQDAGRGQCAFECRGGVETYLAACARNLSHAASARCVLCQTYLEVSRTEASAKENRLVILKRLDVYGKVGQSNPLFCVFSMRKMTEADGDEGDGEGDNELDTRKSLLITTNLDRTTECRNLAYDTEGAKIDCRHVGDSSVAGYTVIPLYVRKLCGCHTAEYDIVMEEMGRPKSSCNCLLKQLAAD